MLNMAQNLLSDFTFDNEVYEVTRKECETDLSAIIIQVATIASGCDNWPDVSTFLVAKDTIFMSYYVNSRESKEDPNFQTARIAYCPVDDIDNKTFVDIQSVGDFVCGKEVKKV